MSDRPGSEESTEIPQVDVVLTPALLRLFPEASAEVRLRAGTVAEMLDALDAKWPGMRNALTDERPAIRRHINVFVNGHRTPLAGRLSPGAKVHILTAVSGG